MAVDHAATIVETAQQLLMKDPILIYSTGKVGTTALAASVEAATGRPVVKAHGLTRDGLRTRLGRELEITKRPRGIWANQWLRQDLRLRPKHPWRVITGVRDPIAIATSAHFYSVRVRRAAGVDSSTTDDLAFHAAAVTRIIQRFTRDEDWFRDEFEPITGIDVYASEFPTNIGYREYVKGRFHVLLIRQEDIRRAGSIALAQFLGLASRCPIVERNTGEGDPLYERFRQECRLPEALVAEAYDTALVRQFYSADEREALTRRWAG